MAGDDGTPDSSFIAGRHNYDNTLASGMIQGVLHLAFAVCRGLAKRDTQVHHARAGVNTLEDGSSEILGTRDWQLSVTLSCFGKDGPHEKDALWANGRRGRFPSCAQNASHKGAMPARRAVGPGACGIGFR